MLRIFLAMTGLIMSIASVAADMDAAKSEISIEANCIELEKDCGKSNQSVQISDTVAGRRVLAELLQTRTGLTEFTLTTKDIDNLFLPKDSENAKALHKSTMTSNTSEFFSAKESKLGEKIANAARVDCRRKYVSPETNLLVIIPLLIETITDTGCRW